MSKLKLRRKYWCPPFWLATKLWAWKQRLEHWKRYPLADQADVLNASPLFIISAGRSGTTLLRSMLVAGGEIAIPRETQFIHALTIQFCSLQPLEWKILCRLVIATFESHHHYKHWETDLSPAYQEAIQLPPEHRSLAKIIDIAFMTYAQQHFPEAWMWGDQSPLHTLFTPWILKAFPQAKFVHMVRDGRDAIASLIERGVTIEEATYRWRISVARSHRLQKRVGPQQYIEVRYEDLVNQPEEILQQIAQFMNITYTPRMLDYWKLPTTIEHKYHDFHRNLGKPVTNKSVGRWKERLSAKQQQYILPRITEQLEKYGYAD
jgi:protein-tyrosine sulfotransferase